MFGKNRDKSKRNGCSQRTVNKVCCRYWEDFACKGEYLVTRKNWRKCDKVWKIVKLKGAKHFTKLDLRSAFHRQLESDEQSRYIAAFPTENKVKQYKSLKISVNSAPEKLQNTSQTILADIDGVVNIADDILIYGITIEQHGKALPEALERFAQKWLTLKLPKRNFDRPTIKHYGYSFPNEGIGSRT